jgi:hypothetical protein
MPELTMTGTLAAISDPIKPHPFKMTLAGLLRFTRRSESGGARRSPRPHPRHPEKRAANHFNPHPFLAAEVEQKRRRTR